MEMRARHGPDIEWQDETVAADGVLFHIPAADHQYGYRRLGDALGDGGFPRLAGLSVGIFVGYMLASHVSSDAVPGGQMNTSVEKRRHRHLRRMRMMAAYRTGCHSPYVCNGSSHE
jgi:hypothetical protein